MAAHIAELVWALGALVAFFYTVLYAERRLGYDFGEMSVGLCLIPALFSWVMVFFLVANQAYDRFQQRPRD